VDWIRRVTRDTIQIEDGALYASLHRMESRGWLDHEWRTSPKGRRGAIPRHGCIQGSEPHGIQSGRLKVESGTSSGSANPRSSICLTPAMTSAELRHET